MLGNRVIPLYLSFVYKHRDRCGGESFGGRSKSKQRLFVNRCRIAELSYAVPFSEDNLIIFDDYHSDARNAPLLEGFVHIIVKSV